MLRINILQLHATRFPNGYVSTCFNWKLASCSKDLLQNSKVGELNLAISFKNRQPSNLIPCQIFCLYGTCITVLLANECCALLGVLSKYLCLLSVFLMRLY